MNERDAERRARWLADDLDSASRDGLEAEATHDPELAEALYGEVVLDEAVRESAKARTVRRAPRPSPRRRNAWWIGTGTLVAALAIVLLRPFFLPSDVGDEPVLRTGADARFALVQPTGTTPMFPRRFVWRAVDRASEYRWELYDDAARRVAVEVVADTVLVRADAETPADSTGTWRWLVVAILATGAEGPTSRSETFTVVPAEDR